MNPNSCLSQTVKKCLPRSPTDPAEDSATLLPHVPARMLETWGFDLNGENTEGRGGCGVHMPHPPGVMKRCHFGVAIALKCGGINTKLNITTRVFAKLQNSWAS